MEQLFMIFLYIAGTVVIAGVVTAIIAVAVDILLIMFGQKK